MLDIEKYDSEAESEKGAVLTLKDPQSGKPFINTATGKPVTITLLGPDSKAARSIAHKQANSLVKAQMKDRGKNLEIDPDEQTLELAVASTKDWDGIMKGGEPLLCTPDNARYVYKKAAWAKDQVNEFINDRANFMKA